MTNTGGTPAGWYHAPGDPDGTQRYWDGAQWVGEPQQTQQQPEQPQPSSPPPAYQPPAQGQTPPAYGAPAGGAGAPPPGYQSFAAPGSANYAEIGPRFVGYLIDIAPIFGIAIAGFIIDAVVSPLGSLLSFVGYIAWFVYNFVYLQGTTGQTLGKKQQGTRLVTEEGHQIPGMGKTAGRYLILLIPSVCTCGIVGLVDVLWPLWDEKKQRLSDKIVKTLVVKA